MAAANPATNGIEHDEEKGLNRTTTGVTMSPELFEKVSGTRLLLLLLPPLLTRPRQLYFSPKVPHAGDNAKRFANPTALGFVGFVISTFTFAMVLMGWGGAEGFSPVVYVSLLLFFYSYLP